jgi:hypothetical protein
MAAQTEFKRCPHCKTNSAQLTISVYLCPGCRNHFCDECLRGFDVRTCPVCTRSIDRGKDKVGST